MPVIVGGVIGGSTIGLLSFAVAEAEPPPEAVKELASGDGALAATFTVTVIAG
jgi:hypothetical protein